MAAARTGQVVDLFARLEQAFAQDADRRQRFAGRDLFHHGLEDRVCWHLQVPGAPLGNVDLPDLFPALAAGASPRGRDRFPARAPSALPLFPKLREVTDPDSGVVKALPLHLGARAGARGVPGLPRNGQPLSTSDRARRVTCALAQVLAELKPKPPRVEAAANPVPVGTIVMRCPATGRRQTRFFVQRGPPIGHPASPYWWGMGRPQYSPFPGRRQDPQTDVLSAPVPGWADEIQATVTSSLRTAGEARDRAGDAAMTIEFDGWAVAR